MNILNISRINKLIFGPSLILNLKLNYYDASECFEFIPSLSLTLDFAKPVNLTDEFL